jgi:phosphoribosylformimino-5-aminoimidazole carboxamide ribotide isomerase
MVERSAASSSVLTFSFFHQTTQATSALEAYPGGLQVGGGITDRNAQEWLKRGASHVIVTSFVFRNGQIDMERLERLVKAVGGKQKLVLDLSCRRRKTKNDNQYYVVTDRWQTYTDYPVNQETLSFLSQYCDEFLIHGVDVEGKQCGIEEELVEMLGKYSPIPVCYAGGARSLEDCERVNRIGKGRVDLTIGSALDCFGGTLKYADVVKWHNEQQRRV